jgi:HAMP domain-containing protein
MPSRVLVAPLIRTGTGILEAQKHLLKPTAGAVEQAGSALERAIDELETLGRRLRSGEPVAELDQREIRHGLGALKGEARRLRALLEGAASLRLGWARVLYTAACGYTAQGQPRTPDVARRVSLEA